MTATPRRDTLLFSYSRHMRKYTRSSASLATPAAWSRRAFVLWGLFCVLGQVVPQGSHAGGAGAAPQTRVRYEEVITLKQLVNEVGQTVRAALESWPRTVRLIVLIAVLVATAAIWTRYHL